MMGGRATAILAVLVLASGFALWWYGPPQQEPEQSPTLLGEPRIIDPDTLVPLVRFLPQDVIAVTLQYTGRHIHLTRQEMTWNGTSAPQEVEEFLQNFARLAHVTDIPIDDDEELAQYGLDTPRSYVLFHVRGQATPTRIDLGNSNPSLTGVYIRINQQGPVILAGALALWECEKLLASVTRVQ